MTPPTTTIEALAGIAQTGAAATGPARALLVGISGIDGSGKGYVAAQLDSQLRAAGLRTAVVNVDGWLNLPPVRFATHDPAGHFYSHALRLDALFDQLVLPLKTGRERYLTADYAEETATSYRRQVYEFTSIDVILLEGIYIFKRHFRPHFDVAVWIDCSFQTALARALARGQEGLPPAETVRAYETIYFPAQRIHFDRDEPHDRADYLIRNDAPLRTATRRPRGSRPGR